MERLQCELCGSVDLIPIAKNVYQCQHCACKYIVDPNTPSKLAAQPAILPSQDHWLIRGFQYLDHGAYSQAIDCFEKHLNDYPEDYRGWWGEVRAMTDNLFRISEQNEDMKRAYQRTLQYAPGDIRPQLKAAMKSLCEKSTAAYIKRIMNCQEENISLHRKINQNEEILKQKNSEKAALTEQIDQEEKKLQSLKKTTLDRVDLGCSAFIVWALIVFCGGGAVLWFVLFLIQKLFKLHDTTMAITFFVIVGTPLIFLIYCKYKDIAAKIAENKIGSVESKKQSLMLKRTRVEEIIEPLFRENKANTVTINNNNQVIASLRALINWISQLLNN